jgi:hypothetical protein
MFNRHHNLVKCTLSLDRNSIRGISWNRVQRVALWMRISLLICMMRPADTQRICPAPDLVRLICKLVGTTFRDYIYDDDNFSALNTAIPPSIL